MQEVIITHIEINHETFLSVRFPYNQKLIAIIRCIKNAYWNPSTKAWLLPNIPENKIHLENIFHKEDPSIFPTSSSQNELEENEIINYQWPHEEIENSNANIKNKIPNQEAIEKIELFKKFMRSRRYSESTVNTYSDAMKLFLKHHSQKKISEISNQDIIIFNNEYILARNRSASFQNQVVNAIKLFFCEIANSKIDVHLIHRPKRQKLLPNILSKQEVKSILDAPHNLKHKAMLSLIYACGLRCGELRKLKPEHIDSKRNVLIIKQAKGRKDRIAPLSDKIIELLRTYYKIFKPKVYLFEGAIVGEEYDERSLQNVLKQSIAKAGIKKPVTLHWLRHSYATHLLESGTDLRYIQEILGHSSSRTTEIYTHVSTKSIQKIVSPFDTL